jgi:hypothetical protein
MVLNNQKEADMLTVMSLEWPGLTPDQYNQIMRALDFDKKPADGEVLHVAGFAGGTLRVFDIWESQQAYEKFQKERLAAILQKVGVSGQPKIEFYPLHNIFTPKLEVMRKAGTSSLPSAA